MDYGDIEGLFNSSNELNRFLHERWAEIHSVNKNYAENTNIKYICRGSPNYRKNNVITEKMEGVRCREKPNVPSDSLEYPNIICG